ncbi:MAG: helix-turn-helix domain-containing protein [Myxococcales bacterium]
MATRCFSCKGTDFAAGKHEDRLELGGHKFTRSVPTRRCKRCGEEMIQGQDVEGFELDVAAEFARHGQLPADAFRHMRRVLGLKATELAELLDVTPETISRWENEKQSMDRRAAALLSAMVLDKLEGRTSTLDRLKALMKPSRLPRLVRLVPRQA